MSSRLATFNILHGLSVDDGLVSTERLVEACRSLDADVLCLQEVDRGQARSGGVDQTAAIAEGLGAGTRRFEPALVGEPGATWRAATDADRDAHGDAGRPEPGYGVGIVSRLAVERWHVLRLKAAPVKSPVAVPGGKGRFILLPDEPRVVLAAELVGRDLVVATTHLSFVPGYNLAQLRRATRWLADLGRPAVLLGDLNVPGPLPRWATGWRSLAGAKTYPAGRPSLQVDHVLAHGDVPEVAGTDVRLLPLSDHRALVVSFVVGVG
ncbi:MAG: endonuclease/exonuclease/phosphatase family protein [Acidimicrobiales bacterium]